MLTDGELLNRDGLVHDARPVSNETVAEKVAKSAKAKVKRSKIRKFRKEFV